MSRALQNFGSPPPRLSPPHIFGVDDLAFATMASGALSGGSGLLGGIFGSSGQQQTNAQQMSFNQQQAERNREWQQNMSNTAYQRAMADMKAAGLNPMLAANLGGASSGGGGAASVSLGNPGSFMQEGITSAGDAVGRAASTRATLTQSDKDRSQVDLNKATTDYTESNQQLNKQLEVKAVQDTATSAAQAANALAQSRAADASAGLSGASAANERTRNRIITREAEDAEKFGSSRVGGTMGTINRFFENLLEKGGKSQPSPTARTMQNSPRNPNRGLFDPLR